MSSPVAIPAAFEPPSSTMGYVALIVCIFAWGSYATPMKAQKMRELAVDSMLSQCYIGVAIFVSSFFALFITDFVFTSLGIITAALWIMASLMALAVIQLIGLSVGAGVWAACSMLVSFLWGAIAFSAEKPIKSLPLALLALLLLFAGTAGVSMAGTELPVKYWKKFRGEKVDDDDETLASASSSDGATPSSDTNVVALETVDKSIPPTEATPQGEAAPRKNYILGIGLCGLLGLFNGSTLVPLHYVPPEASGINFVMSFAIGILIVTPIIALPYFAFYKKSWPQLLPKEMTIYPLAAGLMWNIGNFTSIFATLALGQAIGFTLTQLALVPASMWGILFFKEISGAPKIVTFCVSTFVLLIGAFVLGMYG